MRAWYAMTSLLVLVMAGCATTPQALPGQDAQAKRFLTNPGAATVYVYRPGDNFDNNVADISSVLYVDQQLIGQTIAGVYFVLHLAPGQHVLSGLATDEGKMAFDVQAGQLYFISLQVRDGSSSFTQVSVETGKREVTACCTLFDNKRPGDSNYPTLQL